MFGMSREKHEWDLMTPVFDHKLDSIKTIGKDILKLLRITDQKF